MTDNIPPSWLQLKLGDVIDYGKTQKTEPSAISSTSWVLELEDIEKDTSRLLQRLSFEDRQSKSTKNKFNKGDVLYGKLRPYLNKMLIAPEDGYCSTEIVPLQVNKELVDNRFLFYWLKHPAFLQYVNSVSHGINMPRLGTDAGKSAPFILAPLNEQKRIADKLDVLQNRLDECRERLERVPDLLRRLRQSLFAAAVTGELTEAWRRIHNPDEWQLKAVSELVTIKNGRAFPSTDYTKEGVKLLRPGNLHVSGRVDWQEHNTTRLPIQYSNEFPSYVLGEGELLMNLTAQSLKDEFLGRVCLKTDGEPALLNQRICAFYPKNDWDVRKYLFIYFKSPQFRDFVDTLDSGTLIKHMHSKQLLNHKLLLPTQEEQMEIISRVESLLNLIDSIEARIDEGLQQTSQLPSSILAKAFCGELVPQDPKDEPISELLKTVQGSQQSEVGKRNF